MRDAIMSSLIFRPTSVLLLFFLCFAVYEAQDNTKVIESPVEGPYRFKNFCAPNDRELWSVGGEGQIKHYVGSVVREYRPTNVSLNGVFADNKGHVWVVGDAGAIFLLANSGVDWVQQPSPVKTNLQAIVCIDDRECWVVGDENVLLKTDDGGSEWKRIRVSSNKMDAENVGWNAIDFVDASTGW